MARNVLLLILLCFAGDGLAWAADTESASPFSYVLSPAFMLPLGTETAYYQLGGGSDISVEYALPAGLSLRAGLLYDYQNLQASAGSISNIAISTGVAWALPVTGGLSVRAFADAGYSYGFINGSSLTGGGGGLLADAGAGLAYAFTPNLALRLDLSYLDYIGLYGGLNASLSVAVTPPAPQVRTIVLPQGTSNLELDDITLQSVFPIFHTWYDQHPVGTASLKNGGKKVMTNLVVSYIIKQYMDGPKECATIDELKPGETRQVPLYALFNSSVLDVTEATKSISELSVTYTEDGEKQTQSKTATVRVYNRNAMCWDDNRRAAAFVSGKDPWVQDFATGVSGIVKKSLNPNVSTTFQLAMALHDATRLYGLSYAPSPTTPYSQTSTHPEIVDYVRFPRQTLLGKAGDCSDMSILYASFFESMGHETAFITVPGHIFMAVRLEPTPAEAKKEFSDYDDLIVRNDQVWLPIETTLRDQGFLEAWYKAAQEWKKCTADQTAGFYPVREAWNMYEPVGLAADESSVEIPAAEQVIHAFVTDLAAYSNRELQACTAALEAQMTAKGRTPALLNKLGVACARFERLDLADKAFHEALQVRQDFVPALLNLGNIAQLNSDAKGALQYYRRAEKLEPQNARLELNLAMAATAAGDNATASVAYQKVVGLDPQLAAEYSLTAEGGSAGVRAAEKGARSVLWDNGSD